MKIFLVKISFYIVGIIAILLVLGSYADGNTDDNYNHFVGEAPSDIILGDSRGVQAVVPYILDEKLKGKKFNNFAFNIADSPYGQVYLEALKKKIHSDTKNGIFILTVDPWSLSIDESKDKLQDDPDKNSLLANMCFFNMTPNYEYLLKNYSNTWFHIYRDREEVAKSNTYLHKNGWMEVSVDVHQDSVRNREIKKIEGYRELVKNQRISQFRMDALEDMITFLHDKGTVYIVRIPGYKGIMELEELYSPNFSQKIKSIADKNRVKFFDFSSKYNDYIYTDGNHMYKESSKNFSKQIADSILAYQ